MKARILVAVSLLMSAACLSCFAGEAGLAEIKKGDHYKVQAGVVENASGRVLKLKVVVTDGWKLNEKAPFVLRLSAAGVSGLGKRKLGKKDAAKVGKHFILFELPIGSAKSGKVGMKFDFVICTDMLCQKKRFELDYDLAG
ncbi:MAG: hypothetical protein D6806_05905 [Deltaproteobacteria bacterium]|nr:MAG: hypothetical protein D6806_05905 [Deltaproteobacteria bacterium]